MKTYERFNLIKDDHHVADIYTEKKENSMHSLAD